MGPRCRAAFPRAQLPPARRQRAPHGSGAQAAKAQCVKTAAAADPPSSLCRATSGLAPATTWPAMRRMQLYLLKSGGRQFAQSQAPGPKWGLRWP